MITSHSRQPEKKSKPSKKHNHIPNTLSGVLGLFFVMVKGEHNMDAVLKQILNAMQDGDSAMVRQLLVVNLKRKDERAFVEGLHKLRLKKQIIIQNLDILDIFKLIKYHGTKRFDMKFWMKFYEYQLGVGDVQAIYRVTKQIVPFYKDQLIHAIATHDFYTPAGQHRFQLNRASGYIDVMTYVLRALNETQEHVDEGTILTHIGTIYTPETAIKREIDKDTILEALQSKRDEVFQVFIEERIRLVKEV